MNPDDPRLADIRAAFLNALNVRRTDPASQEAKDARAEMFGLQERHYDLYPDDDPDWPKLYKAWDPTPPKERRNPKPPPMSDGERQACETSHKARALTLRFMESDRGLLSIYSLMQLDYENVSDLQARTVDTVREQISYSLRTATTLAVPEELCELIEGHAPTFPESTIHSSDIQAPHGWAYFAKKIPDPTDATAPPIRGISWWIYEADELPYLENLERRPSGTTATILVWIDTRDIEGTNGEMLSHLPPLVPWVSFMWELDTPTGGLSWVSREDREEHARNSKYVALLCTLWVTIRQRTVSVEEVHNISPKRFKTLTKPGKAVPNTRVSVARLGAARRYTYDWADPLRLDRDFRFPVRAHWRLWFFRSLGVRKSVLVASYLKGPEGAEIRSPERILLPPKPLD